jgi:pimeloyl-ACP methyl ester carboxylesterase
MPTTQVNDIEIHYEERGHGVPVILIMGLGADGSLWEEHAKAYEKHFQCILMDNRGAGRSSKPAGPYTTKTMAEDTAGLMQALGIEKAHISGISMGSAIAQELVLAHPEMVRSLTLVSSWPKCDAQTVRIFEMFKAAIQALEPSDFIRLLQLWTFTSEYHNTHMDDLLQREENAKNEPHPMPLSAFLAQCDACITHDALERLESIRSPTLVTVGNLDIFTPLHYSQTIANKIPGAELFVIPGAGHCHHWEELDAFNAKTLAFMQRD